MTAELYQTLLTEGAWVDLSTRAKWRLSGADRVRYLNGQVTNDVRTAQKEHALYACVTNLKGKIEADIHIHVSADGESLLFDAVADLREPLGMRLERYIIADDAVLEDISEECQLWHRIGSASGESLPDGQTVENSRRFGLPGTDVWLPSTGPIPETRVISEEEAETLRILQRVPTWPHELNTETFPPEAGLETSAMSFTKGCYIGQEILSRIKTTGKMPRQLVAWRAQTAPSPQDMIQDTQGQSIGVITSVTQHPVTKEFVGLAYVKQSAIDTPGWTTASGIRLTRTMA
ncbi:hypothetical protein SAMN02745166_04584 [Prosthecobacter debontii]|uniref:Uncharacterized protein n=1 Tax=Prosthecobacter debontii TaxID=48467 RepID=A0A1T4Z017_9BACT|nr:hypothetical protein [Prosthecobacter debontii]SKB06901.1 hypothetical protein SAMN02745166_04584 [Prosthecobacter debontii]